MNHQNQKTRLLKKLQICDFALHECVLYLDEHPYDRAALNYYEEKQAQHEALTAQYEEKYGPVTYFGNRNGNEWDWVKSPWPWQNDMMKTED